MKTSNLKKKIDCNVCCLHVVFTTPFKYSPQNDDTFYIIDIKIEWQGCIEALAGGGGVGVGFHPPVIFSK